MEARPDVTSAGRGLSGECVVCKGPSSRPFCPACMEQANRDADAAERASGRVLSTPCSNTEHDESGEPVPEAIWKVEFPDGRWNACTACADCFEILVDNLRDEPTPCLFQPVNS